MNIKDQTHSEFHVPVYYSGVEVVNKRGKVCEMAVVSITKNTVTYAMRNDDTCRLGIHRKTKLFVDKNGYYFYFRGKRHYFQKVCGWVL